MSKESQLPEVNLDNIPMPKVKPPKESRTVEELRDELRSRIAQFIEDSDIYLDQFAEERNIIHENDIINAIVINCEKLYVILGNYIGINQQSNRNTTKT